MSSATAPTPTTTTRRLSTLDRWLPLWIGLAMVAGILVGRFIPGVSELLAHIEVGGISVPIALGLLVMMYPVLAKVRYDEVGRVAAVDELEMPGGPDHRAARRRRCSGAGSPW